MIDIDCLSLCSPLECMLVSYLVWSELVVWVERFASIDHHFDL